MSMKNWRPFRPSQRNCWTWWINNWVSANADFVIYAIVSIAILLQQFRLTEPLAAGFFWITLITFLTGQVVVSGRYQSFDPRGLQIQIAFALAGVGLQVYWVLFYWENLVVIDDALRNLRGNLLLRNFLGSNTHKVFGWVIWMLFTRMFVRRRINEGFWFYQVVRRDSY